MHPFHVLAERGVATEGLAADGADVISFLLMDCFDVNFELIWESEHFVALGALQIFDLVVNGFHVKQERLLVREILGADRTDELAVFVVHAFLVQLERALLSEATATYVALEHFCPLVNGQNVLV